MAESAVARKEPGDAWLAGRLVKAEIDSVLVMEDRAQVTRAVELELEAGKQRLCVSPVTPLLADRTLRCNVRALDGEGGPAARALDFQVRRRYLVRAARPDQEQELTRDIESLADEYRSIYDQARSALREHALVGLALQAQAARMQSRLVVGPFDPSWADEIRSAFDRQAAISDQLLAAGLDQQDRQARLERLVQERALALQPVSDYQAGLEVELELPRRGRYRIELEYQVPCALWRPSYAAELAGTDRVRWRSAGMVWQATGEDWQAVELSFSTDRPTLGAELPLLEDDSLSSREKSEREKRIIEVSSRDEVIARTSEAPPEQRADTPPGLDDGGEARTYRVPKRVDVPSDGRPHRLDFDAWESEADCELVCMPEKAGFVFLRSLQKMPAALPLLAGPVELFRHGGYTGRSQIRYVAPGERFELSWGSEDGLVVLRDVEREYEESGLRKRRHHRFEVTVYLANFTGEPQGIRLLERVPVSEIEQVAVELSDKSTPGFDRSDQGLVTWKLDLAPDAERKVRLAFEVSMPQKVVWSG
ncbi:MAG: mucoidy inhibitor MuiA family protein [Deltaproteobacteria bacterium]|nr:mucoidy inhibitor MuiA family protein [Deltaproteobacteria bacterium]